ncbi:MAG: cytochrome-c oxidase, cbb3-type subunit III [Pseudomonadota bacterium]
MSTFWNLWIVGFVTANIIFIAWLLYATSSGKKSDQPAGPETTGHIWDGDLQEYNNPLPRWWLAVFYASIVFAILYLALYPGFGNFKGLLGWSATNELQGQEAEGRLTTARVLAKFDGKSIAELAADPEALGVAENLFAANCTACHGADAHGNKGFPNLARPDLSWGRSEAAILATITAGRQGVMPAWKDILGTESVTRVANYVYSLSGRPAPDITAAAAGAQTFATTCAMCHGATGQGNPIMGAPNLTSGYWIYGGSLATIEESIGNGRRNQMPAWGELLGEQKVRLLAAYVYSLSPPAVRH